jgi:hypothetical protein
MWNAIKEGNVQGAEALLLRGANPALQRSPHFGLGIQNYDDEKEKELWEQAQDDPDDQSGLMEELIIEYLPSSLMLAGSNFDTKILCWLLDVAGVDVNLHQAVWNGAFNQGHCGGFNALWNWSIMSNLQKMQMLLSRGVDPNQACKVSLSTSDHCVVARETYLLLHDLIGVQQQKLLIRYGADPNVFLVSVGNHEHPGEDPTHVRKAYWPNLINHTLKIHQYGEMFRQKNGSLDLEWCEELLAKHGANPNWPIGVTPNEEGESPNGLTVLLRAVLDNNLEVATLLLKNGADANMYEKPGGPTDNDLYGNLYYYNNAWRDDCSCHHVDLQSYGCHCGAFETRLYHCPLSAALKKGNKEMILLLKFHGATSDTAIDFNTYFSMHPRDLLALEVWEALNCDKGRSLGNNKEFALACVNKNYRSVLYLSEALQMDKEVVAAAVLSPSVNNWRALFDELTPEITTNTEIILIALQSPLQRKAVEADEAYELHDIIMQDATDELKSNREIMMIMVEQDGSTLEYASDNLKNDKELVLCAVKEYSGALRFASDELKNDQEIILAAAPKL